MSEHYTPTIEEFHVGFKYEQYEDYDHLPEKLWHKQVYGENGTNPELLDYVSSSGIERKTLRVKYLDQKDIEGEGFEFDKAFAEHSGAKKSANIYHKDIKYRGDKQSLMLLHNTFSNWVLLAIGKPGGASWMVEKGFQENRPGELTIPIIEITATGSIFAGNIKNISELRRVLIQTKTS